MVVNFQEPFLNEIKKRKIPVKIYLMSGGKLSGVIKGFDQFIILLSDKGKEIIVYKSAIAFIEPQQKFLLTND